MLLATMECVSQSKWLLFRDRPQKLIDFHIIDEASRGPYGAMTLLFRMRGRAILASAGAFIIFASLAVEPFTQQVLSYPLSSVIAIGGPIPTVPRMQSWIGDIMPGI